MAASQSTPGTQDKDKVAADPRVAEGTRLSWQARFDGLVVATFHWRPEDREKFYEFKVYQSSESAMGNFDPLSWPEYRRASAQLLDCLHNDGLQ